MLTRAFVQLAQQSPEVTQWLLSGLRADTVEVPGVSGEKVRIIAWKADRQKQFLWDGQTLLATLERTADTPLGMAVAWLLLCFHDVYYDTDALLRDYIKNVSGVQLERTPFTLEDGHLVTECSSSVCKRKPKTSGEVVFQVDKNSMRVLLPLSSSELKDLLFGRLRRIDT
jgi:hypothetical protein